MFFVSSSHLHGAPAHGDHLEQGHSLHLLLFPMAASRSAGAAASGFDALELDVL